VRAQLRRGRLSAQALRSEECWRASALLRRTGHTETAPAPAIEAAGLSLNPKARSHLSRIRSRSRARIRHSRNPGARRGTNVSRDELTSALTSVPRLRTNARRRPLSTSAKTGAKGDTPIRTVRGSGYQLRHETVYARSCCGPWSPDPFDDRADLHQHRDHMHHGDQLGGRGYQHLVYEQAWSISHRRTGALEASLRAFDSHRSERHYSSMWQQGPRHGEDRSVQLARVHHESLRFHTSQGVRALYRAASGNYRFLVFTITESISGRFSVSRALPDRGRVLCGSFAPTSRNRCPPGPRVDRFGAGDLTVRVNATRKTKSRRLRAFDRMADRISTLLTAERRLLQTFRTSSVRRSRGSASRPS